MRRGYLVLTALLVVAVVLQFYFAAFGVFTHPENDSQYLAHRLNAWLGIPLLSLLATGAAVLARAPGRLVGLTALPAGLVALQTVLFVLAGLVGATREDSTVAGQVILGLHALNGLVVLWNSIVVLRRARAFAAADHQ